MEFIELVLYLRAISRDETMYPSPEEFLPERFESKSDILDPRQFAFGYGRR